MMRWSKSRSVEVAVGVFAFGALLGAGLWPLHAAEESEAEAVGRRIYHEGDSGRGITAVLGEGGTEVPAAVLPCASCHGSDGIGRPEGGLRPSDITWPALERPGIRRDRAPRPPYEERSLIRAITMGLDSDGLPLHSAMPRYRLTREEAEALVAYLRLLGSEETPGISETAVRLGVLLPPGEAAESRREAIRGVLASAARRGGVRGQIFGRRLDLRFLAPEGLPAERLDRIRELLAVEEPFALLAPYAVGIEDLLSNLLAETGIPAIGPFSAEPPMAEPPVPEVFYILPGLQHQARALVRFAEALEPRGAETVAVVLAVEDARAERLARAISEDRGVGSAVRRISVAEGAVGLEEAAERLLDLRPDAVLILLPRSRGEALVQRLHGQTEGLILLFVGPLNAGESSRQSPGPVPFRRFVAWPTLPRDTRPEAWASYQELVAGEAWSRNHRAAQLSALAAFELAQEALRRAGRRLNRERLIEALEGMYQHETGYSPAVTFHPNRRVGALGAWVIGDDEEEGVWVSVESKVTEP